MQPQDKSQGQATRAFRPAMPAAWLIACAQAYVRANLALSNHLIVDASSLAMLKSLPPGAGIILTSNHADETDPQILLELSRLCQRRFVSMCNREAFDEYYGLAGWTLQRLGHFSVERGAHDNPAKEFALQTLAASQHVLVIFPEGEIYYLNDAVQEFHTGTAAIGLEAIMRQRTNDPNWTVHVVPMGIKYHYENNIEALLSARTARMEARLKLAAGTGTLAQRLRAIQSTLLSAEIAHHHVDVPAEDVNLTQAIHLAQDAMLANMEEKYQDKPAPGALPIDESWKLGAAIRKNLEATPDAVQRKDLESDLATVEEIAHLASWNPHYYSDNATSDRLAEALLKLERELYRQKRPHQLGPRRALVKVGEPIDLGAFAGDYATDAHATRKLVTARLHDQIQSLVDSLHADISQS